MTQAIINIFVKRNLFIKMKKTTQSYLFIITRMKIKKTMKSKCLTTKSLNFIILHYQMLCGQSKTRWQCLAYTKQIYKGLWISARNQGCGRKYLKMKKRKLDITGSKNISKSKKLKIDATSTEKNLPPVDESPILKTTLVADVKKLQETNNAFKVWKF
ncbi:unnamed protein product [Chilo suppressalis]|uniref:FLYWCH-type domain-containing protein n=1 Tax=Chilo suppressalis TaxID=168631 RepID=A0ABN8EEC8_CHISP|nr:unnamed protein product [Chilo suppressalis]